MPPPRGGLKRTQDFKKSKEGKEAIARGKAVAEANKDLREARKNLEDKIEKFTVKGGGGILQTRDGQAVFRRPETVIDDQTRADILTDDARFLASLKAEPYETMRGPSFDSVKAALSRGAPFNVFDESIGPERRFLATFDPDSPFAPGNLYGRRVDDPLNNLRAAQTFSRFAKAFDQLYNDPETRPFDIRPIDRIGITSMDEFQNELQRLKELEEGTIPTLSINKPGNEFFVSGYDPVNFMSQSLRDALLPGDRLFDDFQTDRTINQFNLNPQTLLPQGPVAQKTGLASLPGLASTALGAFNFNPVMSERYFGELDPRNYTNQDLIEGSFNPQALQGLRNLFSFK